MLPWISIGLFVNLLILPGIWPLFHLDTELLLWEIRVGKKNVQNPKPTLVWGCWWNSHHTPSNWSEMSQPGGHRAVSMHYRGCEALLHVSYMWQAAVASHSAVPQFPLWFTNKIRWSHAHGNSDAEWPSETGREGSLPGKFRSMVLTVPTKFMLLNLAYPWAFFFQLLFFQRKAKRLNLLPLVKLHVDYGWTSVLP